MTKRRVLGYRRENGRVGVRNHVIILPVDDISNAACEAVANNIKGTLALPHAYGRLQFGEDLELFFRTMIGTGATRMSPPSSSSASRRAGRSASSMASPRPASRSRASPSKVTATSRPSPTPRARQRNFCSGPSSCSAQTCEFKELYICVKCGESDTTTGLSSCPTVGNVIDKHCAAGRHSIFGETSELTGGEHIVEAKAANEEVRKAFMAAFQRLSRSLSSSKRRTTFPNRSRPRATSPAA